jgi:WD40 repeat protein
MVTGDGLIAVTGDRDGAVRVWDLRHGWRLKGPWSGHIGGVTAVAVGDLGGRPIVISGSPDGAVRVWDLLSGGRRVIQVGSPIQDVALSTSLPLVGIATTMGLLALQMDAGV